MAGHARKIIVFAVFLAFATAGTALAVLPQPTGYVNDFANVLDARTRSGLESTLSSLEQRTGAEVAVVTVNSLEGAPIEDYAVKLFQTWGIGKKGKDNGALILVAPNERQVRIEVGYGLEGAINDALAGRIIRERMLPAFKAGDFNAGIAGGTMTVAALVAKEAGTTLGNGNDDADIGARYPRKKSIYHTIFSIFFFLFMAYLFIRHPWLFLLFMSGMGRGGGRGFGGGFGGFGGGLSGGGGASGRW